MIRLSVHHIDRVANDPAWTGDNYQTLRNELREVPRPLRTYSYHPPQMETKKEEL